MKITAVCPNCSEEISFDGIKLFIEGSNSNVKSKLKSYIGWGGNDNTNKTKGSVSVPPPTPPADTTKELETVLDQVIKKTPPADKEMQKYLQEEQKRDNTSVPPPEFDKVVTQPITKTMIVKPSPPSYDTLHIDNTKEEARDVLKREVEKQELVTAVTSQLAKLGEDIKPDLHTIAEAMAKQASESKKKGICLVCNNNPGVNGNLICQECLTNIVKVRTEEEHKKQLEQVRTLW